MERVSDVNYVEMIGVLESPFEFCEYDRDEPICVSTLLTRRASGAIDRIPISINKKMLDCMDKTILSGKIKIQGFLFCRTRNNKLLTTVRITEKILPQNAEVQDRNFVRVIGSICKIPKFYQNEIPVCKFMISVKAEHQPRCFIPVITMRGLAYAGNSCDLKQRVNIRGKLGCSKIYKTLDDGSEVLCDVYEIYANRLRKIIEC